MVVGFWSNGKMAHASLFLCYFSETEYGLVGRVFCIELFVKSETNQIVLSIKGPIYNTRDYDCKQFYLIHANMNEIIDIATEQIRAHGTYKYWTNNCRTFASNCLEKIKAKCGGISAGVEATKMNKYIQCYVTTPKSGSGNAGQGVSTFSSISIGAIGTIGTVVAGGNNKQKAEQEAKALSFIQVLKKYPLK